MSLATGTGASRRKEAELIAELIRRDLPYYDEKSHPNLSPA
jgi:hypothetical protein